MKKNNFFGFAIISVIIVCFSFTSCEKADNNGEGDSNNKYINDWIYANLDYWYLWNDKIPAAVNKEQNPKTFFYSLLYKRNQVDGDRFSWIQDNFLELLNSLSGIEKEAGFDFSLSLLNDKSDEVFGFVNYIKPNSPAAAAGLKRGDLFLKINGTQITTKNIESLIDKMSENYKLTLAEISNNIISITKEISLNVVEYHENPIFYNNVYQIDNKKIGYLVYNFFSQDDGDNSFKYIKELNNVFGKFKNEGINELILDLRYNGGGSITNSIYLASMIVKNLNSNNVFVKRQYNSELQNDIINDPNLGNDFLIDNFQNNIIKTDSKGNILETIAINNVGLSKLYVITGYNHRTASASELIINGLMPYMDVYLVGGKTAGKNVGSISIYKENDNKNKWGMQPLVLKLANSNDYSSYETGFTPDVNIVEYGGFTNIKQLGDVDEIMLAATLQYMKTGTFKTLTKSTKEIVNIPIEKQIKGMYIDGIYNKLQNR